MGSEVYDRSESGTLISNKVFPRQQETNGCKNKNAVTTDGDKGFSLVCEDIS